MCNISKENQFNRLGFLDGQTDKGNYRVDAYKSLKNFQLSSIAIDTKCLYGNPPTNQRILGSLRIPCKKNANSGFQIAYSDSYFPPDIYTFEQKDI